MKKGKEDKAEEILSEKNEERKRAIDAVVHIAALTAINTG